jgi:hypothetical protein
MHSPISAPPMLISKATQGDEGEASSPKNPGHAADFQPEPVPAIEANQPQHPHIPTNE